MLEAVLIGLGVLVAVAVGFWLGVMALIFGGIEMLKDIDGPPKLGWYGEWKLNRANKKYEKNKRKKV